MQDKYLSHILSYYCIIRKIVTMFCVSIVFLCRIRMSFSNLENPHDEFSRNYKNNKIELNGPNSTANIVQSFGDETMRSVIKILSKHKQLQEKSIELYRISLNNTVTSDQSYIIFNRNAKSGSETLRYVISILSTKNNFTMVRDRHSESILSEPQRRYFFDLWKSPEIQYSFKCKKKTRKLKPNFIVLM